MCDRVCRRLDREGAKEREGREARRSRRVGAKVWIKVANFSEKLVTLMTPATRCFDMNSCCGRLHVLWVFRPQTCIEYRFVS